jgi:hypothetical protein
MNLVPTDLNQRLASALRYSVVADRAYIAGRAGFWRFIGCGLVGLGLGCAVGLGFFGYSYVIQKTDGMTLLTSAFSSALSEARLRATAEGTVQLDPREISLAKDQSVSLDSSSRVALEQGAKVVANGELTLQAPTISVPQGASQKSSPKAPVITNFTVFKSVPFGNGNIFTGWIFLTSVQNYPTSQYCYYTESSEVSGADAVIDVGDDQKPSSTGGATQSIDMAAAFNRCVWFKREAL